MFKPIRAVAVLLVFTLAAAAQSPAQNWNNIKALSAGTFVRISVVSRTVRGQVQEVTDESLVVDSGKGKERFTRQEVMRASVKQQGHRGRHTLVGLGAGAAIGGVIGAAGHSDCTGPLFCTSRGQDAALGAFVFGVIGAAVGALIPTGGWHQVYKR